MNGSHLREQTIVDYTPRVTDRAHLSYLSEDSPFTYQWTGHPADPIEMCQDDVVLAVIAHRAGSQQPLSVALAEWWAIPPEVPLEQAAVAVTHWFQHICDEWTAQIKGGGEEPTRVRDVSHG